MAGVDLDVVMAALGFMPVLATDQARSNPGDRAAPLMRLQVSQVPFALSLPQVNMVWATHADSDPANAWLRQLVRDSLSE